MKYHSGHKNERMIYILINILKCLLIGMQSQNDGYQIK